MKKETKYIIDEKDYELLKLPISENPCLGCVIDRNCCGCDRGRDYKTTQKKFTKNNLAEARKHFIAAKKAQETIIKQQKILEDSRNALKGMGFNLDKLF